MDLSPFLLPRRSRTPTDPSELPTKSGFSGWFAWKRLSSSAKCSGHHRGWPLPVGLSMQPKPLNRIAPEATSED